MFRVPEYLLLQQGVPGGTLEENADSDQGGCALYVQAGHAEGGGFQMWRTFSMMFDLFVFGNALEDEQPAEVEWNYHPRAERVSLHVYYGQ